MKTIDIRVSGQVQGVFFRKSTVKKATDLGINGTVKNKSNGNVKIIATGTQDQLGQLMVWCLDGSDAAKVHKVTTKEIDLDTSFNNFEVVF